MMKVKLAAGGAVLGALIGEFAPGILSFGLDSIGAAVSEPFSSYRNGQAFKFLLILGAIGFVVGLLLDKKDEQ